MPINVYWDNEDTKFVIRQEYVGQWTRQDYITALKSLNEHMSSVEHPIYIIVDMREMKTNPMQVMNIFSSMRDSDAYFTDNHQGTVVVGASPALRLPIQIARQVAKKTTANLHTAFTIDEAYAVIEGLSNAN